MPTDKRDYHERDQVEPLTDEYVQTLLWLSRTSPVSLTWPLPLQPYVRQDVVTWINESPLDTSDEAMRVRHGETIFVALKALRTAIRSGQYPDDVMAFFNAHRIAFLRYLITHGYLNEFRPRTR